MTIDNGIWRCHSDLGCTGALEHGAGSGVVCQMEVCRERKCATWGTVEHPSSKIREVQPPSLALNISARVKDCVARCALFRVEWDSAQMNAGVQNVQGMRARVKRARVTKSDAS